MAWIGYERGPKSQACGAVNSSGSSSTAESMFSDSLSDKPGTDPALRQTSRWTQTQAEANVYSFKQEP